MASWGDGLHCMGLGGMFREGNIRWRCLYIDLVCFGFNWRCYIYRGLNNAEIESHLEKKNLSNNSNNKNDNGILISTTAETT